MFRFSGGKIFILIFFLSFKNGMHRMCLAEITHQACMWCLINKILAPLAYNLNESVTVPWYLKLIWNKGLEIYDENFHFILLSPPTPSSTSSSQAPIPIFITVKVDYASFDVTKSEFLFKLFKRLGNRLKIPYNLILEWNNIIFFSPRISTMTWF